MKTFFVVWISQAASLLGSGLVQFALAWYLASSTGSASVLAVAVLIGLLPQVIIGPFIGPFVDRWNRKTIIITSDIAVALVTAGLAVLYWTDAIQVWHIYTAMFLRSIGGTFHFPAVQASVSLIVPEKHLTRAAGLIQMLAGVIAVISPILGALVLAVMPMQSVLAIDIGTAALAVVCLAFVKIPKLTRSANAVKTSPLRDMMEGFRFIWSWKGAALLLLLISMLNFFFNPAFSLLPILITKHFGGGAMELGWLESAVGAGMIAGGLAMGIWGGFKRRISTTLVGILIASVSVLAIGFVPQSALFVTIGIIFVTGVALPVANSPLMAIIQSVVPKEIQGRVFTLIGALSAAMSPLGLAIAGPLVDATGVQTWYLIAGSACLLVTAIGFFIPALMNIESQKVVVPSLN
jgi:DHA3 family macrolide efflux protein-like MFS transporter